jgi:hypothetical protein
VEERLIPLFDAQIQEHPLFKFFSEVEWTIQIKPNWFRGRTKCIITTNFRGLVTHRVFHCSPKDDFIAIGRVEACKAAWDLIERGTLIQRAQRGELDDKEPQPL